MYVINVESNKRDSCAAIRGSFELLHSVYIVYIETKHGGKAIHCGLVMSTSLWEVQIHVSVDQFKCSITKFLCCAMVPDVQMYCWEY